MREKSPDKLSKLLGEDIYSEEIIEEKQELFKKKEPKWAWNCEDVSEDCDTTKKCDEEEYKLLCAETCGCDEFIIGEEEEFFKKRNQNGHGIARM